MTWPKHLRFVFRGVFNGSPEQWSFGCHFASDEPLAFDVGLDNISESGVTSAVDSYLAGSCDTRVVLTDWRAYNIQTTGRLPENSAPLLVIPTAGAVHGTNPVKYPPQVALKITTVATGRGAGTKGGWFVPGPGKSLGADSRISTADAFDMAQRASAFLKGLSDAIDVPGSITHSATAINVSEGPVGSTTGTSRVIDHVECGRVYDTIRNRRKSLVEDRQVDTHIDW